MITIDNTQTDAQIFAMACRENTGSHFLDSGGAYGRWHEKPPIDLNGPAVTLEAYGKGTEKFHDRDVDIVPTIRTSHYLAHKFSILRELQSEFQAWQADRDGDWFTLGQEFMASKGFVSSARDNVYNGEQDLDQVFVWEVFQLEENKGSDWIFDKEAIAVIWVHTGCDVRGGYGSPLFCECSDSEYSVPISFCAQWGIIKGTDADGSELSDRECQELGEHWMTGYSHWPTGEFMEDIDRIVSHTETEITVVLKSGETVTVSPELPW